MSTLNFRNVFPHIDATTEWYLEETVEALQRFEHMSKTDAYNAVVSSKGLRYLIHDDHMFIQTESGYYWAMYVSHGPEWWKDKKLVDQYMDYLRDHHGTPPPE